MGMIGEIFALAGLHLDEGSFEAYAAQLKSSEGQISQFSEASSAIMAGAFAAPAVAIGATALKGVEMASGLQDASVSLTNLYGSSDIAREKFQWMTQFAAQTPFNFDQIAEAGIKLKSYGMDIEDYGRTMGDTAAIMGKNINDVVEAYADAGQGEFERLKEFGVKAVKVQTDNLGQYAKYGAQLNDTVLTYTDKNMQQCAQVVDRNNSQMVYSTLNNIFDIEKGFQGAMQTRSKTLTGMMSTITDNLEFGIAKIVGFGTATDATAVRSASLFGVISKGVEIVGSLTSGLATLSPAQANFIAVVGTGVAVFSLLTAGLMIYGAAMPMVTAANAAYAAATATSTTLTAIFGSTLSAAIWPATAVVLGLAALAAGLTYLDEKTGIVSASWQLLKDLFTITVDGIMSAAGILRDYLAGIFDQIQTYISNMIPSGFVETVSGIVGRITGQFGSMSSNIHQDAENIRTSNNNVASSMDAPKKASDTLGLSFLNSGKQATGAADAYKDSGVAAKGAKTGYDAATGGLNGTTNAAKGTKSALNSVTQAALDSANAIKQVWAAQNQIAKTNITIAEANKSIGKSYGTSPNGLGSYNAKDGTRIIAAPSANGTTANARYNQEVQALQQAGVHVNVAQINNYGESTSATKTTMAVHGA
jgi:hypothetical protein